MNYLLYILKAIVIGFITGIIISVPLGPAGIESVKRTISKNFKAGFIVSLGAIGADAIYLLLINLGLKKLFDKNRLVDSVIWVILGLILIFINYLALKKGNNMMYEEKLEPSYSNIYGFITGFLITFTNPLTPSLWLTLSATVLKKWREINTTTYYIFILSILLGMITWFTILNLLAFKGKKSVSEQSSTKFSILLKWMILFLGIIFVIYGFIEIINILGGCN